MKHLFPIFFLVFLCISTQKSLAQTFHTASNKALKEYNEGVKAFDYFYYDNAEGYLKEALATDKGFYEAYIMLGDLMIKLKRYSEAASNYRSAVKIDSLFYKPVFFNMANSEMMSGDYNNALVHFNVYLEHKEL
jgi:tetratricopeptide (TPR) repeat protein